MSELSKRIAELSPEKRKLFEQLVKEKVSPSSGSEIIPEHAASVSLRGANESAGRLPQDRFRSQGSPGAFQFDSFADAAKTDSKRFFDELSEQLDSTVVGQFSYFLNYGYFPNLNPQYAKVQLPGHYINKNSVKLVLEVIGDCVLTDCRVLDVGCGRGGTAYVIHQFLDAKTITGIDLSSSAISFCKAHHRYPGVNFQEGDAEKLPFEDESFEVVTNIESSSCYPNIHAFYSEVCRVLTPGGYFLYTDVLPVERMNDSLIYLKSTGFLVERDRDITTNVLLSCDGIALTRMQAFNHRNDPQLMRDFLGAPGSQFYEEMKQGRWTYRILKLKKAEEPPTTVGSV
jgi:phthiocerol/phenolphthiocerol synthesis type-I polyketide synthase E